MSKFQVKVGLIALLLLTVMAGASVFWLYQNEEQPLTGPTDPQIHEAIRQARTQQKQGKLKSAMAAFEKYAAQGYPEAMYHAGKSYGRGWGVEPDLDSARNYFLLAVQHDFAKRGEAAYELGRLFQRSQGPDCNIHAVKWFKKALNWEFEKAALQLAIHYEKGLGVNRNMAEAIRHYETAVDAGYEKALLQYARLLVEGPNGVAPDAERAAVLAAKAAIALERKARDGSGSAAKQLGRLYRNGKLLPANPDKAQKWLLRAARLGSTGGMHELARMLLQQSEQPEEHAKAITWLKAAAEKGHGGAMTTLGRFHLEEAYSLTQSEALDWFKMGVAVGHGGAMEELAKLYEQGLLVPKNHQEAVDLARQGAQMGHSGSKKLLKLLLEAGADDEQAPKAQSGS